MIEIRFSQLKLIAEKKETVFPFIGPEDDIGIDTHQVQLS